MIAALKRLHIYFKEMYPIIPRLLLGGLVFGEIYFIVLLNHGVTEFNIGPAEFVCAFTVFSFLCWLRIADDFKDYELDCRLFKERPLPSGRVTKKDLGIFVGILIAVTLVLNFIFMNNALYMHSATEGRKLDCLKSNPCVGFSVHKVLEIDREHATTRYESLCGEGRAVLVDDPDEKQKALAALALSRD